MQGEEFCGSQRRIVPSAEQDARRWRGAEYARPHTESSWPASTLFSIPGSEGRRKIEGERERNTGV